MAGSVNNALQEVLEAIADGHEIDWSRIKESHGFTEKQILSLKAIAQSRLKNFESAFSHLEEVQPEFDKDLRAANEYFELLGQQEDRIRKKKILGDFKIIREIGKGGMATVYEVEQISLNRRIALKVLPAHLSFSSDAVKKFKREAEAGGRQNHPGIVAVYLVGEHEGTHYIAQELVEGGYTLADRLRDIRRGMTVPSSYFADTALLIKEAADALGEAHQSGVIHRDVKPSNILLTKEGQPKITDFGLAKVEDALALSRTGDFVGTPYYMSPEQVISRRSGIDHRTDIYSLAVTLYELLSLKCPFEGKTSREVMTKILSEEPKHLRKANSHVPRDLAVICHKAMEKNPNHRYQKMAELSKDLESFAQGEPILARPISGIRRWARTVLRSRYASFIKGVSAFMVIAAMIAGLILLNRPDPPGIKYEPIGQVLDLSIYSDSPWRWCKRLEPDDPSGYLLSAIYFLEKAKNLGLAEKQLHECFKQCRESRSAYLLQEAHYLLGVLKVRQANSLENESKKQALYSKAAEEIAEASSTDYLPPKTFLRFQLERFTGSRKEAELLVQPLLARKDHILTDLYIGLRILQRLYKGGERKYFDQARAHLKIVLQKDPSNLIAMTCLGRVKFFYARYYNRLETLNDAMALLKRARENGGAHPSHWIYTTLGQVHLLYGDHHTASALFEEAIRLDDPKRIQSGIHNAYCGLGTACAISGNFSEAEGYYLKARDEHPVDPHTHVALAEFYLQNLSDIEKALDHAEKGVFPFDNPPDSKEGTWLASAHLVRGRIHIAQNDFLNAMTYIQTISNEAIFSPRDIALACLLIASIPEHERHNKYKGTTFRAVSDSMVSRILIEASDSPIVLSAIGADHLINGRCDQAIECIQQAMEKRKSWPSTTLAFHWPDDLRDRYLLTQAYLKSSAKDYAEKYYNEAEAIYKEKTGRSPFVKYGDILKRIRDKTRRAFGYLGESGN